MAEPEQVQASQSACTPPTPVLSIPPRFPPPPPRCCHRPNKRPGRLPQAPVSPESCLGFPYPQATRHRLCSQLLHANPQPRVLCASSC